MSERPAKSVEWTMKVQASRAGGVFYWAIRGLLRLTLLPWLRVTVEGTEHLDTPGPVILAPVHRSNLDSVLVACTAQRRLRALGKESLFTHPIFAWVNAALGAIPVRRGEADRQAMKAAQTIIADGAMMIVFLRALGSPAIRCSGSSTARPTWLTRPVRRSFPSGSGERRRRWQAARRASGGFGVRWWWANPSLRRREG